MNNKVNIKLIKNVNLSGATLIEGFPGAGLVGAMAISYMIEKIKPEFIGYIDSDQIPPIVSIHNGIPMPPIRIYYYKNGNFICIFSDFSIQEDIIYDIAEEIIRFVKENKLSQIISIGGMPVKDDEDKYMDKIFTINSNEKCVARSTKFGMKIVKEGISTGISALLMLKSVQQNIDNINILIPIKQEIVDPKYAEYAINGLNSLLDLDIDVTELDKEAKIVEAKIKELKEKDKSVHSVYKTDADQTGPSMYA